MTAIERYAVLKAQIAEAEEWAALVGKSGVDGPGAVTGAEVQMVISWKANPSADNKHRAPNAMRQELEDQVIQRSANIISGAITDMKAKLAKVAKDARDEYAELMNAAGLPP